MKFRVLTYNVNKLFNLTRTFYFLSELKMILKDMDLDFVFLQEIRGEPPRSRQGSNSDPLEYLADQIWDHYVYGKNAIYTSGNHGNAILSKYPFGTWENLDLTNHRWEKRSLLIGKPEFPNWPRDEKPINLRLMCTHLDLTHFGRIRQSKKIESVLQKYAQEALIFGGDFNDWRGRVTRRLIQSGLQSASTEATFPSFAPFLSLDRIFFGKLRLIDSKVLQDRKWKRLSDHLPLFAEFEV